MTKNLTYAVLGAAIVGIIVWSVSCSNPPQQVEPICADPPGEYHTVTITWDPESDPSLIVTPMLVKDVQQCDVVTFINLTGQDITIDFGAAAGGIGTPFNEVEKFDIEPEGVEGGYTKSPQVWVETPEKPVDYTYHVSVGEIDQSPVIRIGPRKSTSGP